jgi:hypothetical protein
VPVYREGIGTIDGSESAESYIVGTRGKGEVNTGTNHLGFRCVKSPETNEKRTVQE